jgi:hypothetical protein
MFSCSGAEVKRWYKSYKLLRPSGSYKLQVINTQSANQRSPKRRRGKLTLKQLTPLHTSPHKGEVWRGVGGEVQQALKTKSCLSEANVISTKRSAWRTNGQRPNGS